MLAGVNRARGDSRREWSSPVSYYNPAYHGIEPMLISYAAAQA